MAPPKMIAPVRVQITGLNEFRNGCRRAQVKMPAELTKSLRTIGNETKKRVRARLRDQYTSGRSTGRLEKDIHVKTAGNEMRITEGENTPYAGWWEFGGNSSSPPPPRERIRGGRALYPVLKSMQGDIESEMELFVAQLTLELEAGGL
jgi:hypothetical protein